ncbi:hypothetical protein RAA17_05105 [Komagataeibacter rhaeticus]|nr:hypothetical protein [Komagataeibacter rhaeticus]
MHHGAFVAAPASFPATHPARGRAVPEGRCWKPASPRWISRRPLPPGCGDGRVRRC